MIKKLKKTELKQYEKILIKEREQLLKGLAYDGEQISKTQVDSSGDLSAYSNHIADQGTETEKREITSQILSKRRENLFEVDLALRKVTSGKYGFCENCGKPIEKRRLKILPQARKCVKCSGK